MWNMIMNRMRMYWAIYRKEFKSIRGIAAAVIILQGLTLFIINGIIDPVIQGQYTTNGTLSPYPPSGPFYSLLYIVGGNLSMLMRAFGFMLPAILLYLFVREALARNTLLERALPVKRSETVLCRVGAVMTAGIPVAFLDSFFRFRQWDFITNPLFWWRMANGYYPERYTKTIKMITDHRPERLADFLEMLEDSRSFPIRQIIAGLFPFIKRSLFNINNYKEMGEVLLVYLLLCAVVVAVVGISNLFRPHSVFAGIVSGIVIIGLFSLLADPVFTEASVDWYSAEDLTTYFTIWTAILLMMGAALIERYEER